MLNVDRWWIVFITIVAVGFISLLLTTTFLKRSWPIGDEYEIPPLSVLISSYHCIIFLGVLSVFVYADTFQGVIDQARGLNVLLFGALGSALNASRTVVKAVRGNSYEGRRVLWQLLSPIHGAVLSVAGYVVFEGGILSFITESDQQLNSQRYTVFLVGCAFLIGFSSELFIKRLIRATEALFGETDDSSKDSNDDSGKSQKPLPSSPESNTESDKND